MMRSMLTGMLSAACLMFLGCEGGSVTEGSTPEIQSRVLSQLSAGGGIAGYDFYVDIGGVSTRVGALVVTNGVSDPSGGYYDQKEYWRWDSASLATIETGAVTQIDVDFFASSATYDATIIGNFESGTGGWTAWDVNREFNLNKTPTVQWNNPAAGIVLYTLEADAWGGEAGTITYYLKMDFNGAPLYPEMYWYVAYGDYVRWSNSEAGDGDYDGIWEVRLTDDTVLDQTSVGVGYELKTVK